MAFLGKPILVQNTDGPHWYISFEAALKTDAGEVVSFTVAVPRNGALSISEIQTFALKRAVEILQDVISAGY